MRWWMDKVRERTGDAFFVEEYSDVDDFIDNILGVSESIWPSVRADLHSTFDAPIKEAIKIDGIGSGKSSYIELAIDYCLHILGCLKDPARVYGLLPGAKIAIVIASLRELQAKEIIFDSVKYRLNHTKWFRRCYRYKEKGVRQLEFPNRVFLLSGSSSESIPIGFNILVSGLDEGDWFLKQSHIGDFLDQAENIYESTAARVESRFETKGLMLLASSARLAEGFMLRRYKDAENSPSVFRTMRAMWEAKPGQWAPYFVVSLKDGKVLRENVTKFVRTEEELTVPMRYKESFMRNPRKFLRDRASALIVSERAYVLRPDAIRINMERVSPILADGRLSEDFKPKPEHTYYSHTDLGETRDKAVTSVGHQDGYTTFIDLVYVIDPKEEGKVDFDRVLEIYYELDARGFDIGLVTFDSYQCVSSDSMLLCKMGFKYAEDVRVGDFLWNGKRWTRLNRRWDYGEQVVSKIVTRRKYELSTSSDHTHVMWRGKQPTCAEIEREMKTSLLEIGDVMAMIDQGADWGGIHINNDLAYLLGFAWGDATMSMNAIQYCVGSMAEKEHLKAQIYKLPGQHPGWGKRTVSLHSRTLIVELKEQDLYKNKPARELLLTQGILQLSKESLSHFLGGLFDADGCVGVVGGGLILTSSSLAMIRQVQTILRLGWGIASCWSERKRGYLGDYGPEPGYTLSLSGSREKMLEAIRLRLKHKRIEKWLRVPGRKTFERVIGINQSKARLIGLAVEGGYFGVNGFYTHNSHHCMQKLEKRGFAVEWQSVDKDKKAYDIWLEAHYSDDIDIYDVPGYREEAKSLMDKGNKVDHLRRGSKDITDSVAGTTKLCRTLGMSTVSGEVMRRAHG